METISEHRLKDLMFEYQYDITFSIFIITFSTYYSVYADFYSVWLVGIFYYALFFFEWSS